MKKLLLLPILLLLSACAASVTPHLVATNLTGSLTANGEIKNHVHHAQTDINDVLKSQAGLLQTTAALKLRDAQTELAQADATIDAQAADLTEKQKQIDAQTNQYNHLADDRDQWKRTAEARNAWAWRWAGAFFGLLGIVIALRIFRTYLMTIPVIGPLLSSIL